MTPIIKLQSSDWENEIRMALIYQDDTGAISYAKPFSVMIVKKTDEDPIEPCWIMPKSTATQFFNEFWRLGFRPSTLADPASQVAAIQYHLEDMRRLVFDKSDK